MRCGRLCTDSQVTGWILLERNNTSSSICMQNLLMTISCLRLVEESVCVHACVCNIQGLCYTHVVLSSYLYLSSFLFSCTFFANITFFQSISSIYTSLGKAVLFYLFIYFFCHSSKFLFAVFSCVPSNIQLLLFFSILDIFYMFLQSCSSIYIL